jgi:hypothetical protein
MAWPPLLANVTRASVLRQSHSHEKARVVCGRAVTAAQRYARQRLRRQPLR